MNKSFHISANTTHSSEHWNTNQTPGYTNKQTLATANPTH
jgi:hypothetical protein